MYITKQNWTVPLLILLTYFFMVGQKALAEPKTWSFDNDKTQALPTGWLSELTGQGAKGDWQVIEDATAPSKPNVIAQLSADSTSYRFPLAIADNTNYKDPDMTVHFKTISGKEDQGAGLVWRYRDANNY
jgi:hypothetical protein